MILDISIDSKSGKPTVEGSLNHKLGTQGGGMLQWRCEPGKGHQGWEVVFKESPFESKQKTFSGSNKPAGDRLARRDENDGEQNFKYYVSCTDSNGVTREADPEVVIWPG